MIKKAPGWGKAIGIIMICLGGLGVFYQIYKMILPRLFGAFSQPFNDLSRLDNDPFNDIVFDQFDYMMGMSETHANMMIGFGLVGLALSVFYIIGGVKLLTVSPANYNFAKYALTAFIVLNAVAIIYFFATKAGFIIQGLLIYAIIGLVFDITLVIILLSSNKADYGIGLDESMQGYTVDAQDEEIL